MRRLLLALVIGSFASVVACTIENSPGDGSPSSSSGGSSSGGTSGDPQNSSGGATSGSSGSTGSSSGSTSNPPPSSNAAEVDIDGTCSAFTACGGDPQGTYDYTGGCIEDVFAAARNACPALDTTNATVNVKGSIYFTGNALSRDVTVTIGGALTFPQSCTLGMCSTLEAQLKGAFDSVSCTGSSACTCTVSKTEVEKDATTYTIQGSTATTADGDTYSICEKGADLSYSGKSAGSEEGIYTMKKR
jgi:hypothetical protein